MRRCRYSEITFFLQNYCEMRRRHTFMNRGFNQKLSKVYYYRVYLQHPRNSHLVVLNWKATRTMCCTQVEPIAASMIDLDTGDGSNRSTFSLASHGNIKRWTCCTRRAFPKLHEKQHYGKQTVYNFHSFNLDFVLKLHYADTSVTLSESHLIQNRL